MQSSAQLYGVVGGEVAQAQIDYPLETANGCALKVSRALNYSGNTIHDLKVLKEHTKMIRNYKCFKVIYTYSENNTADVDFSAFMGNFKVTREMWVTSQIKAMLHPIINDQEILSKYYPLEIIETSEMSKGKITHYEVENCTLK